MIKIDVSREKYLQGRNVMDQTIMVEFINNAALLLVLSVIYEITYMLPDRYKRLQQIFNGILISLVCIAVMMIPFTIAPGLIYDTRSILISVVALIFGLVPTVITVIAAIIFRFSIGGIGTVPGVLVILSSASIGLAWRHWIYPNAKKHRWLCVYAMSIAVHITMLVWMLLLPYPDNLMVIEKIYLPILLIYPIVSVLLTYLLLYQQSLKKTQKELKQSEERFQLLFNKAPLGYQSLDFDGNFIDVNQQWLDMLGYSREEVIGKWFGDFLSIDYQGIFRNNFMMFKEQGEVHCEIEMLCKNGNSLCILVDGKIGYDLDGGFKQTHCILKDITKQKAAEMALQNSEKKYRDILENMSDVIWNTDLNFKTNYVSPSVVKMYGDSIEDYLKRTLEEKFPLNALNEINLLLSEELEKEKDLKCDKNRTRTIELEHYRADGTLIWVSMHIAFLHDENGKIIGFQGVTRDISARKKAEAALLASELRYRRLFEAAKDGVIILDASSAVIVDVNPYLLKLLGYSKEQLLGKAIWEIGLFNDTVLNKNNFLELKQNEYIRYEDLPLQTFDGRLINVEFVSNVYLVSDQKVIQCNIRDITERKLIAAALFESEKRLLDAQKIAHVGNWELNLSTKTMWASQESFNIYGIVSNSQYLPLKTVQANVLPEYRKLLNDALDNLINRQGEYNVEFKLRRLNDKKILFVNSIARLQLDTKGDPIKVIGTIQDITERKKAEEILIYTNYHDYLTGLYNRRFFEEKKILFDVDEKLPLSVIISDINGLKIINDALGHTQGDNLIVETSKIIQSCCRNNDVLARIGGDEFSILLPKTDRKTAEKIMNKIRVAFADYNKKIKNETFHISIALGYGTKNTKDEILETVCKNAEDAMYQRKMLEHKSSHSDIISSIKATMIEKSNETEEHAERLVFLSRIIGKELGLSQLELDNLELYATLHDIGKVGIINTILKKPSALNDEEWVEMKKHSSIGHRIAMSVPELAPIAQYILSHHERWDGNGYPQGLSGENIPLLSRILAIVDAYDAMTENRIYRKAMSKESALEEIINNAGTQFDPDISKTFIQLMLSKVKTDLKAS